MRKNSPACSRVSFEPFYSKIIASEMIYIKVGRNSVNNRTDIANLSLIYNTIIE